MAKRKTDSSSRARLQSILKYFIGTNKLEIVFDRTPLLTIKINGDLIYRIIGDEIDELIKRDLKIPFIKKKGSSAKHKSLLTRQYVDNPDGYQSLALKSLLEKLNEKLGVKIHIKRKNEKLRELYLMLGEAIIKPDPFDLPLDRIRRSDADNLHPFIKELEKRWLTASDFFYLSLPPTLLQLVGMLLAGSFLSTFSKEIPEELLEQIKISPLEIIKPYMPARSRGRGRGSGWFRSPSDFLEALQAVLKRFQKRPTQLQVLKKLDMHYLCQLKPKEPRKESHTKLLRNWLQAASIESWDEAIKRYYKP